MLAEMSIDRTTRSHADAVRRRAEEIYEKSGRVPGRDKENWAQAEAEIAREAAPPICTNPAFIVIRVKGITYTAEYDPQASDYKPGELAGAPVRVRFEDDRMFITRPNGEVLETRVVKQELK